MTIKITYFLIFLRMMLLPFSVSAQDVELRNRSFYIDGKKFFVKGIGYEIGATPGKLPWTRTFNADLLRFDIQRILAGGFNTIRTWAPFTAQELDVLKQYDIKIIMGIWIDPAGNFADPAFVSNAVNIVSDVLSYSKNYRNIIGYIIMNEPLPETIAKSGYDAAVTLWKELTGIIHDKHPGRPVSIANTPNGTFIGPEVFDFSAYNVYIYNPAIVNYLHGYRAYIQYLNQLNYTGSPLIVTEYGLSVSPTGPGNQGYGGNSLAVQSDGIVEMYKALVDGGAAGSCVFNYSDGWWKAGNESVHDDAAEEWFGLVNYTALSDQFGVERPVWKAVKEFQSAIIAQPRSSEIYPAKVPIEIFFNDTIDRIEIRRDNQLMVHRQKAGNYLLDTLIFNVQVVEDANLVFDCFDANNNLVKREQKNILIAPGKVDLPAIKVTITNPDYWKSGYIDVNYQIERPSGFVSATRLDYIFYPHVGFNYGDVFQTVMPASGPFAMASRHYFNSGVNVITVGAAFEVTYGNFKRRIVNQVTLSRLNHLLNGREDFLMVAPAIKIYPCPARENINITLGDHAPGAYKYYIINSLGAVVQEGDETGVGEPVNIRDLMPGIYYIRIILADRTGWITKKLVKL